MNRLAMMILKNFGIFPWTYAKLCHYAKHTEKYSEGKKYEHIRYMFTKAIKGGNVELEICGQENVPKESGYLMYANHQGLFDILAIVAAKETPFAVVLKKELYKLPLIKQMVDCTRSYSMDRDIALVDCFKVLDLKGSKPLKVKLQFLPVIPYEEYAGMTTKELAAMVKARIEERIQGMTKESITC